MIISSNLALLPTTLILGEFCLIHLTWLHLVKLKVENWKWSHLWTLPCCLPGGEALPSHRVVALLAGNRDQCPRWSGGFVLWSPLTISTCWPDQMAGLCLIILIVYDQIQLIVDQITHCDSYQGFTALHLACWRGSVTVVRRLLNCPGGVSSARDSTSCLRV